MVTEFLQRKSVHEFALESSRKLVYADGGIIDNYYYIDRLRTFL
jgi:hypothetical protein